MITNEGRAVDPDIVLNAPTFKTLNPYHMPDYAGQGIEYLEDWEDWLEEEGRWMDQQTMQELGEDVENVEEEWTPERYAAATVRYLLHVSDCVVGTPRITAVPRAFFCRMMRRWDLLWTKQILR